MNAADYPRSTAYFSKALIVARTVIEDSGLLSRADGEKLAGAVTERLLGDFLWMAQAGSQPMFTMDGQGPFCSWCGKRPGLVLPAGHPQYGIFCDCKRDDTASGAEAAAPEPQPGVTP